VCLKGAACEFSQQAQCSCCVENKWWDYLPHRRNQVTLQTIGSWRRQMSREWQGNGNQWGRKWPAGAVLHQQLRKVIVASHCEQRKFCRRGRTKTLRSSDQWQLVTTLRALGRIFARQLLRTANYSLCDCVFCNFSQHHAWCHHSC